MTRQKLPSSSLLTDRRLLRRGLPLTFLLVPLQNPPGVSELTDEPWKFEVDPAGRLKCLCCCASSTGSCGKPGHDRPGLAARARAEVANRAPPPQYKPQPQVADGYGRLAGPREWGGGAGAQQQGAYGYAGVSSPPRGAGGAGGARNGGGAQQRNGYGNGW